MKVLFIIPPCYPKTEGMTAQRQIHTIPYGVLSLAAYAKDQVSSIKIIDLSFEKLDTAEILKFKADVTCISALFDTCYPYLKSISRTVKILVPNCILVIGGGLATNIPERILEEIPEIDACCYGEGEIPLAELINADTPFLGLTVKDYLDSSPSWWTRNSSCICFHNFVENLDNIPPIDYSLIDLPKYGGRSVSKINKENPVELSIHTSRGCPFNCIFCSNGSVHGKKIRYVSIGRVITEIDRMVKEYGMNTLLIEDDHFLSLKGRTKIILGHLRNLGIQVEFPNGLAVRGIDKEVAKLLADAGVKTVTLAVESGSDYVLKEIIDKPHKVKQIKPAVKALRAEGISVEAFIIVGLPGETDEHRYETMRMIFDVGFDWVKFSVAVPVVGSRLYDLCKEKGYLVNDLGIHNTTKGSIKTPAFTPEEIEEKTYQMNIDANFIGNYNTRTGNYEKAAGYFRHVIKNYPDHAIAHYCLAKCLVKLDSKWEKFAGEIYKLNL